MSKYNTDIILDNAKNLLTVIRDLTNDPQEQVMALRVAADQIEREVAAEVQVQAMYEVLKGIGK